MKITSINYAGYINNLNNKSAYKFNNLPHDIVSFTARKPVSSEANWEEIKLRMQARDVERKVSNVLKEEAKLREDAYYLKQEACNINKEAEKIIADGSEVFFAVKQALTEGKKNSFKPVQDDNGYTVRLFKKVSDSEVVIEEYLDVTDEDPSRIISVNSDTTSVSDTDIENGQTDVYVFDTKTGRLKKYAQDVFLHRHGYSAAKQYVFNEKGLYSYDISHKVSADKSKKSAESFIFSEDGRLKYYFSNLVTIQNGTVTSDEKFDFEDGRLKRYSAMNHIERNQASKSAERFLFSKSGDVKAYSKGYSQYSNGANNAELYFVFGNDTIENAYIDFSSSGSIKARKVFSFIDGNADKCMIDFNKPRGGNVTSSKVINVQAK